MLYLFSILPSWLLSSTCLSVRLSVCLSVCLAVSHFRCLLPACHFTFLHVSNDICEIDFYGNPI